MAEVLERPIDVAIHGGRADELRAPNPYNVRKNPGRAKRIARAGILAGGMVGAFAKTSGEVITGKRKTRDAVLGAAATLLTGRAVFGAQHRQTKVEKESNHEQEVALRKQLDRELEREMEADHRREMQNDILNTVRDLTKHEEIGSDFNAMGHHLGRRAWVAMENSPDAMITVYDDDTNPHEYVALLSLLGEDEYHVFDDGQIMGVPKDRHADYREVGSEVLGQIHTTMMRYDRSRQQNYPADTSPR